MQFITSGDRIAVENFTIGDLYTITFVGGTYINTACIGKGADFVTFQRNLPELLFSLTMETAELVSSIDLYAGGTGTNNYNDLTNKPQINDVELVGNKSLSDLGIQPTISDIDTIRSGAAAGATAVQPAALADYQPKIDSSHKLDADLVDDTSSTHKFATAAQLSQIGINENNILSVETANGKKQLLQFYSDTNGALVATAQSNGYSVIITGGDDNVGKTVTYADCTIDKTGTYTFSCNLTGTGASCYIYDATTGTQIKEYYATSSETLTLTGGHTYQLKTYRKGSGTNAIVEAMICESALYAISSDMRPYAMSNAEITAWILAHS